MWFGTRTHRSISSSQESFPQKTVFSPQHLHIDIATASLWSPCFLCPSPPTQSSSLFSPNTAFFSTQQSEQWLLKFQLETITLFNICQWFPIFTQGEFSRIYKHSTICLPYPTPCPTPGLYLDTAGTLMPQGLCTVCHQQPAAWLTPLCFQVSAQM